MTEGRDSFFRHSCESRNPGLIFVACEKEKEKTLDPRLLMSRMTEGGEARMTDKNKKTKEKTLDPLLA